MLVARNPWWRGSMAVAAMLWHPQFVVRATCAFLVVYSLLCIFLVVHWSFWCISFSLLCFPLVTYRFPCSAFALLVHVVKLL